MKYLAILVLAASAVNAQDPRPKIGVIDFYGVQKVPLEKIRKALAVKEGDPLPSSKGDVESRLRDVTGIVGAALQATCCEDGNAILYVGIEEKGALHFEYHAEAEGEMQLPAEIIVGYREFLGAVTEAIQAGVTGEDLTAGHSLMKDSKAREAQQKFVGFAEKYKAELHDVIRNSGDPEVRAISAYVIGYTKVKSRILDDLYFALRDPDDTVRSNAIRALAAIAVKARLDPESELKISPTWFIEMLNSVTWTDRNYAASALATLTDTRDRKWLDQIKERAWPSVIEMAKWKHLEHALPAYILLGRVADVEESDLTEAWGSGKRDEMIRQIVAGTHKKRRKL